MSMASYDSPLVMLDNVPVVTSQSKQICFAIYGTTVLPHASGSDHEDPSEM